MLNRLRILFNVVLYRLGIRKILPREAVRRVRVVENNDFLVDISTDKSFFFDASLRIPVYVRNTMYHKLKRAQHYLPRGTFLKIYDAYRSLEQQRESWERALRETARLEKNLPLDEIKRITRLKVAEVGFSAEEYGGHQTGGAVDVTLCDQNGIELPQGTAIAEYNQKTPTINPFLSLKERRNRVTLGKVMSAAGFRNFPAEWWHFSYGDRLWAAYMGYESCVYGLTFPPNKLVRRGRIADGLDDVSKYLGLEPRRTIYIHSVGNPDEKKELNPPPLRHAQVLSYLSRKSGGHMRSPYTYFPRWWHIMTTKI